MSKELYVADQVLPPSTTVLEEQVAQSNSVNALFVRPPRYLVASVIVSCVGMLFGLDTGCIGSVTSMPAFVKSFGQFSSTVHGAIISTILISASITSFFAGHLSEKLGRAYGIMVGSGIFSVGAALEAGATSLGMFIGGRAIKGVGEGLFLSTLTVYICEISPACRRGSLASMVQFLISIGICVGFFMCYGSLRIASSLSWRLPSAVQSAIAATLAILCLTLPPSPRWMINRGQHTEAYATMDRLGLSNAELEVDSAVVSATSTESGLSTVDAKQRNRFLEVFSSPCRKQTILGTFMMVMCQFTGIDGVLYYAPTLFKQAGLSSTTSSFLASGITGILGVVVTIPASLLADRWNRRTSLIGGGIATGACMFVIGSLYASEIIYPDRGAGRWVVIVSIYLYTVFFGISWGVTIKIYATEVQPARTRAAASSLGQGANWIANFLVAFTTPIFLAYSSCGVYFLFGSFALLTAIVCTFCMPETRGRSLETIEASFNESAMGNIISKVFPKGEIKGGKPTVSIQGDEVVERKDSSG